MNQDLPIILIENPIDDLWICLPMRHKDLALKMMKMIEKGRGGEWSVFMDIGVNFAVGFGETPQKAQEDFYISHVQATNLIGIFRENLFEKIVAKKTEIELSKIPKEFM